MARAMSTGLFRQEAQRRLIDTWSLMLVLGLRSKQAIWKRVEAGKLPEPVINIPNVVALWDRNAIPELQETPDA